MIEYIDAVAIARPPVQKQMWEGVKFVPVMVYRTPSKLSQDQESWLQKIYGAEGARTLDPWLAKPVLYQLSYSPIINGLKTNFRRLYTSGLQNVTTTNVVGQGGLEPPTSRLSGVYSNQLSY